MTVPTVDLERVYKVSSLLLDCACEWLALTPNGCPDRRGLVPGEEAEDVNCCAGAGQLTVNLVNAFPSRLFPVPDVDANNCDAPFEVVTFGIQVARCAPVGDERQAPSVAALDDAAYRTMIDVVAVRNGVTCCLRDKERVQPVVGGAYRWLLGDHLTFGPRGGCAGSNLAVVVGLPTCWECP